MSEQVVQASLEQHGEVLKRFIPAGFFDELAYFPVEALVEPIAFSDQDLDRSYVFTHCQPGVAAFVGDIYEVDRRRSIETTPYLELAALEGEVARRGVILSLRYARLHVPTGQIRRGNIPDIDSELAVSSFQLRRGGVFNSTPWGKAIKVGGPRDQGPRAELSAAIISCAARMVGGRTKRQLAAMADYNHATTGHPAN